MNDYTRLSKIPILLVSFIMLISCMIGCQSKSISEQEAISITQDFVNNHVKFYVDDEQNNTVDKASIQLLNIARKDYLDPENKKFDSWYVFLRITSNETGEEKKGDMLLVINAKDGAILNWGKVQLEQQNMQ